MDADQIRSTVSSLEKASAAGHSDQSIIDILRQLDNHVVATEALLRDTKLGLAVGKLRNHSNGEIAQRSKDMVKKWKNEVVRGKKARSTSVHSNSSTPTPTAEQQDNQPNDIRTSKLQRTKTQNAPRDAKTDHVQTAITGDSTRDACIKAVYNSLAFDSTAKSETIIKRATAIDVAVFAEFRKVDAPYRNKMRSLMQNLKAQNNPALRQNVVSGTLSTERFCTMSPREMASEERKAEDAKLEAVNIFNARGAKEQKAVTDRFQCGKCKNRKVSYYQLQTRSADEPMTTFCEVSGAVEMTF